MWCLRDMTLNLVEIALFSCPGRLSILVEFQLKKKIELQLVRVSHNSARGGAVWDFIP